MNWPLTWEYQKENSLYQGSFKPKRIDLHRNEIKLQKQMTKQVTKERRFNSNAVKKEEKRAGQKLAAAIGDVSTAGTT